MPAPIWTAPRDWVALDVVTATQLDEVSDNFRFLHDQGDDITPVSGLLTLVTQFHKVTGAGSIVDNFNVLTAGARVELLFVDAVTLRHNSSGTGNIRLQFGADKTFGANQIVRFLSDGALWWEIGATPRLVNGIVNADGTIPTNGGTGFAVVRNTAGSYTITYGAAFAFTPSTTFSQETGDRSAERITAASAAAFTVAWVDGGGSPLDVKFHFVSVALS